MKIVIYEIEPWEREAFEDLRRILDPPQANVHAFIVTKPQDPVS